MMLQGFQEKNRGHLVTSVQWRQSGAEKLKVDCDGGHVPQHAWSGQQLNSSTNKCSRGTVQDEDMRTKPERAVCLTAQIPEGLHLLHLLPSDLQLLQ